MGPKVPRDVFIKAMADLLRDMGWKDRPETTLEEGLTLEEALTRAMEMSATEFMETKTYADVPPKKPS